MNRLSPVFASLLLISACGAEGNGKVGSSVRSESGFTAINNQSQAVITVTQGTPFSVVVSGDSNLLGQIATSVDSGVLTISNTDTFLSILGMNVAVTLPTVTGLESCGSGAVNAGPLSTGALALDNCGSGGLTLQGTTGDITLTSSGSGDVKLKGQGGDLNPTLSGSGSIDASGFTATGANVAVSGSGSISIDVAGNSTLADDGSGSITAALSGGATSFSVAGSGSISWSGQTSIASSVTTGSGSIEQK